ncbi:hypothetical protein [Legionella septentrionalis]|uniref:Uncharacterized protein n=1 Tax=Legionella septentrionalis TaxID=2498109 RepID=A0A433JG81_9GAMM|nr:hypothetical protein [Legionella septentrionalis]RUQ78588.1 hypothetical protein EKM59_11725 [Legionella septentrionalis]
MTYPEDSIQSVIHPSEWWINNTENKLCRGALIFAFAPHIDQIPYAFEPIGRKEAEKHDQAKIKVSPIQINKPFKPATLPVAAMPNYENEVWAAYRAKKRPCIVLREASSNVDKSLTQGKANHSVAPTITIAPYYGADENGKRAGYTQEFRERVRHCEYPQFLWDKLPVGNVDESILRLDHSQPYGAHSKAIQLTDYKLSPDALDILDDLISWITKGGVSEDSILLTYREAIEKTFYEN